MSKPPSPDGVGAPQKVHEGGCTAPPLENHRSLAHRWCSEQIRLSQAQTRLHSKLQAPPPARGCQPPGKTVREVEAHLHSTPGWVGTCWALTSASLSVRQEGGASFQSVRLPHLWRTCSWHRHVTRALCCGPPSPPLGAASTASSCPLPRVTQAVGAVKPSPLWHPSREASKGPATTERHEALTGPPARAPCGAGQGHVGLQPPAPPNLPPPALAAWIPHTHLLPNSRPASRTPHLRQCSEEAGPAGRGASHSQAAV